jgi:hypothetical protein
MGTSAAWGREARSSGAARTLLFRADRGAPVAMEGIPHWILNELVGADQRSAAWTISNGLRFWPMKRQHPISGQPEFCGIEFDMAGAFSVSCKQGKMSEERGFGLWLQSASEPWETLDAGVTWHAVKVPKLTAEEPRCEAMGCFFGPYYRAGWGP